MLQAEEADLRHALHLAEAAGLWSAEVRCLQGLRTLYQLTGREAEWARLVATITPDFTDPDTDEPLPGREALWAIVTDYRIRLARITRDWATATPLLNALVTWYRHEAVQALAAPVGSLTSSSSATKSATLQSPSANSATSFSCRMILNA